uniref:Uncharacterized protein n=1 Tax=Siphoviridae sp. ctmHK36 TaxID=2827931 RepID=A0A8S5TAR3_9CAUD|nr:MAG TPA: hypothetical protein [Siphoviridae sp. ctmHK36]
MLCKLRCYPQGWQDVHPRGGTGYGRWLCRSSAFERGQNPSLR